MDREEQWFAAIDSNAVLKAAALWVEPLDDVGVFGVEDDIEELDAMLVVGKIVVNAGFFSGFRLVCRSAAAVVCALITSTSSLGM